MSIKTVYLIIALLFVAANAWLGGNMMHSAYNQGYNAALDTAIVILKHQLNSDSTHKTILIVNDSTTFHLYHKK